MDVRTNRLVVPVVSGHDAERRSDPGWNNVVATVHGGHITQVRQGGLFVSIPRKVHGEERRSLRKQICAAALAVNVVGFLTVAIPRNGPALPGVFKERSDGVRFHDRRRVCDAELGG